MKMAIRKENEILYGQLSCGDIFRYGTDYYIRTNIVEEDTDLEYLSVNLSTGEQWCCGRNVGVSLVGAELYVSN